MIRKFLSVLVLSGALMMTAAEQISQPEAAPEPAIKITPVGTFFSGKDTGNLLVKIQLPYARKTEWNCGGEQWKSPNGQWIVALPAGKAEGCWEWQNGKHQGKIAVKAEQAGKKFFTLEQGIKITAPRIVRRNETCGIYAECWNRWHLPLTFRWQRLVSQELPGVTDQTMQPSIAMKTPKAPQKATTKNAPPPPKGKRPPRPRHLPPPEAADRFLPGAFYGENLTIPGSALPETEEWHCRYILQIPGMTLLEQKIRLIPVNALPEMQVDCAGNWIDPEGSRVLPVLPARELPKQRKNELLRRIGQKTLPVASTLVIGNDFGSGEKRFSLRLGMREKHLQFADWHRGSAAAKIAVALNALRKTDAEAVIVLIPPPGLREADDGAWLEFLELLESCAWAQPSIRKVTLAVMPAPAECGETEAFLQGLRKLVRDRDTKLLEIDSIWHPVNREKLFREEPENPGLTGDLPIQAADAIAAMVLEQEVRKED